MSKKVLLVDAFSLAFRAFYSYPTSLQLPDGTPTNMVYGFMAMTLKAIEDVKPTHVCICFDRKEPTFRHEMFPDYKGHRPSPPDEFKVQVPLMFDIVKESGLASFDEAGYEADDIIGTLAKKLEKDDFDVLIMTGDHDSFQLVSDKITVVMNKKGVSEMVHYTPDMVRERYGLGPEQIVDFKALKGDASDNIPGVAGIGDKTATKLLKEFGTLEGLFENIDDVSPPRIQSKLRESKDIAILSQTLATIYLGVPVDVQESLITFNPDWALIVDIFKRYHFNSLAKKYEKKLEKSESLPVKLTANGDYQCIDSLDLLKGLLGELNGGFSIHLETTGLKAVEAQIVGIALSMSSGSAFYIPCNDYLEQESDGDTASLFHTEVSELSFKLTPVLKLLKPLLEDVTIPKFTHDGKYEAVVLSNYGISLKGIHFDTMLAAFLVFPGEKMGLKALVSRYLGIEMTSFDAVVGKEKKTLSEVPLEEASHYAAADADMTYRLMEYLTPRIEEKSLGSLFTDIELPSQYVLSYMEKTGVSLDTGVLRELSVSFSEESGRLKQEVFELSGGEFNLNSPKQLAEILYDKMGLPVLKKTKTGRSTDSSVLEKLAVDYDIANKIMRYRTLEKLLGTYVNALPHMLVPRTGKVHTSFNQTVAITGRLSSTGPNLQNIPIRTAEGMLVRKAFVPSGPGRKILSIDYSQIELRVMAHMAQDTDLIAAFSRGEDIHARTAAVVNNVDLDDVTKTQRYEAKAVNFGILYGQSSFGLSEQLHIGRKAAKVIIDDYFLKFPKIKAFIDSTIAKAQEDGFVRTEFGRYRYLSDINNSVFHKRQFAERAAVNTRVQGTSADIMKIAMVRVFDAMKEKSFESRLLIQVHDELVFDVLDSEYDALVELVISIMEGVVDWEVPLNVDVESGPNWMALT